jgi:DNA-binding NarL/FixJ family response regulator
VQPAESRPIRVVVAEDHTIVRQGIVALLSTRDDIEVVGEAEDGRAALREVARTHPDVLVMDLAMPALNGVDATRQVRKEAPSTRVLVLSMHGGEEHVRPAIRAGASGFLLKGSGLSDLVAAIRAVAVGDAFFSPSVAKILLRDATHGEPADEARPPGAELTSREREVVQLVAEGMSSPEIAALLHLSPKTVENHRARIMAKLDIRDVAGLVRYAIRVGLASPDA